MDYNELAAEFLHKMQALRKVTSHRNISEALQGESFVLRFIHWHNGDVLPSEISNEMEVSSARVAAALNSLENKGLITRQIDPSDRRKILVGLTVKGKEVAESHHREVIADTANLLQQLGEQDAKEYVRLIGRLGEIAPPRRKLK